MNWYYVDQGKQAGPVDESQLARLFAEGRIQDDTLVWREGLGNWLPFREIKGSFIPATPPPPISSFAPPILGAPTIAPTDALCVECRNVFSKENMIRYGNSWVCASCKPVFMQKVAEGVTTLGAGTPGAATEADLLARDYDVDIGGSISKGWELFKINAGILIGTSVIFFIIVFGAGIFANLANLLIPLLGGLIVNVLITAPLRAGLWLAFIKVIRGGPGDLSDLFKAFGPRYWRTVLVALVPLIMVVAIFAVFGVLAALMMPAFIPARGATAPHPAMGALAVVPVLIFFFILLPPWIYIAICWVFSMPLVIDKGLRFWPAMELSRRVVKKHWWGTFGLCIVVGLLGLSGVFACIVGVVVTFPVAFASLSAHYEKVFGDLAPEA